MNIDKLAELLEKYCDNYTYRSGYKLQVDGYIDLEKLRDDISAEYGE